MKELTVFYCPHCGYYGYYLIPRRAVWIWTIECGIS